MHKLKGKKNNQPGLKKKAAALFFSPRRLIPALTYLSMNRIRPKAIIFK